MDLGSPEPPSSPVHPSTAPGASGPGRRVGWDVPALVAILAVGAGLRFLYLAEPMRVDEAYTFNEYARGSVYDAVSLYTFPNNHLL